MPSPFSQTMESRRLNLFYVWEAGLVFALLLALGWAHWFFKAPIAVYETSRDIRVVGEASPIRRLEKHDNVYETREYMRYEIAARFSGDALANIKPGQPGKLYIEAGEARRSSIPVTVAAVTASRSEVLLHADVPMRGSGSLNDATSEMVEIEVDHTTPAAVVISASGAGQDTYSVSCGPAGSAP